MSIEITAVGRPQKLFGPEPSLPEAAEALTRLMGAGRITMGARRGQGSLRVRLCPGASVEFWPSRGLWNAGCAVDLAGPGAHAAMIGLLDALGEALQLHWQVDDPTGYARRRDFGELRQWHIRHLQKLSREIDQAEISGQRPVRFLFWPLEEDAYPVFDQGIVTPMGWFADGELAARAWQDPEALALDLFVWPNQENDGWYWRNLALWSMWNRIFWVPELSPAEQAPLREALAALEQAAGLDQRMPLPLREYQQLCELLNHPPQYWENPAMSLSTEIGFRKQDYRHSLGSWSVVCDGALVESRRTKDSLRLTRGDCIIQLQTAEDALPPLEGATFALENPGTLYEGRYEATESLCRLYAQARSREGGHALRVEIGWPPQQDDGWARMILLQIRYEK